MARKSTTRYAIMALLTIQPMSGYDVRRAFGNIGGFWNESAGQIYPTLKKLVAETLAVKSVERQDGKPDRHVYTLTEAGQGAIDEWLIQPAVPAKMRDELLMKLFFSSRLDLAASRQQLEQFQTRSQENLALYNQLQSVLIEKLSDSPDFPFRLMVIRNGIILSEAALVWCAECLQTVQKMEIQQSDVAKEL